MNFREMARVGDMSVCEHIHTMDAYSKERVMLIAAQHGHLDIVQQFISQNPPADVIQLALFCAAHDNQTQMTVYLIDQWMALENKETQFEEAELWSGVLRYCALNQNTVVAQHVLSFPEIDMLPFIRTAAMKRDDKMLEQAWHRLSKADFALIEALYHWGKHEHIEQCFSVMNTQDKNQLFLKALQHKSPMLGHIWDACKDHLRADPSISVLGDCAAQSDWSWAEKTLPYCDVEKAVAFVKKENPTNLEEFERLILTHSTQNVSSLSKNTKKM